MLVIIAKETGRIGKDVIELVGRADRNVGVAEHAHLKRQKQKGSGETAHGREKGDDEGRSCRNKGKYFNFRRRKIHGFSPGSCLAGKVVCTMAIVSFLTAAREFRGWFPFVVKERGIRSPDCVPSLRERIVQ